SGQADAAKPETDSFIGWTETYAHLPAAKWLDRLLQGRRPDLTTSSVATQLAACLAGQGLAVLPHFLCERLVCLKHEVSIAQDIWLVTQSDVAHSRRVKAVAHFCRELVGLHQIALRGPNER
ncbi:MAG: LysR substrate-binding domain-containing protein, partial [Allorhizobium sp.]